MSAGGQSPERRALLARLLADEGVDAAGDRIPRRGDAHHARTSFAQERLWFLNELDPLVSAYTVPSVVRLRRRVDATRLRTILDEIVRRHEILRTTFPVVDGRPLQRIHPSAPAAFAVVDLESTPAAERERELRRLVEAEVRHPFALGAGPLLRATLWRVGDADHVLAIVMHHIVCDGWSGDNVLAEVARLHRALECGEPPALPEPRVQYADFAEWQRERAERLTDQLDHWIAVLRDPPPPLELPADRRRPAVRSQAGGKVELPLGDRTMAAIERLGRAEGATTFMIALTAFGAALHRWTGEEDLLVGVPVSDRTRPELEGLIGVFVNTLVLRLRFEGRPTFRQALRRVRRASLDAFANRDVPFERLLAELGPDRSLAHTPLFQVMFSHRRAAYVADDGAALAFEPYPVDHRVARFDLTLYLVERPEGARLQLEYACDLFERATVRRMATHVKRLLQAGAATPDARISQLPLLTAAERARVLRAPVRPGGDVRTVLHERFAEQVRRTPDAVAVTAASGQMTYAGLDARAGVIARALRTLGVGPEDRVGVCVERDADLVAAVIGVLKAGGAYVGLDPGHPPARLAGLVADARPRALVAHGATRGLLPRGMPVVLLDGLDASPAGAQPATRVLPANAAYVSYTSGSTGRPKGVVVTHANVLRLFGAAGLTFGPADVWSMAHSIAFDFSVWELWGALLHGGRVVVVPADVTRSPGDLHDLVSRERVSVLNQTPSAFAELLAADAERDPRALALRLVVFGGEALDAGLLRPWMARHPARPRLVNMYGITETTVHVTAHDASPADADGVGSCIGVPLSDLGVRVLDREGEPAPPGVPGELHVAGAGLARGYLGRPALTAERFVPDPFAAAPGARMYRSGDRGAVDRGGRLRYLGRVDDQVQIRGHRVEPAEVEAGVRRHPAVRDVAVVARARDGQTRLIAYVAHGGAPAPAAADLRRVAAEVLPAHMLPAEWVTVERLPLTANGKVDRTALPPADGERSSEAPYAAPRTDAERVLASIWAQVLDRGTVGIHDNFFDLGGDSILAMRVVSRAREAGLSISARHIFEHQTVAELAPAASGAHQPAPPPPEPREVLLAPVQHWFLQLRLPQSHHFNQTVLLEVPDLEPEEVRTAARMLSARHDALRLRLDGGTPSYAEPEDAADPFALVDLSGARDAAAGIAAAASALQASLDLRAGPLHRVALLALGGGRGTRLLVVVHHLAVDRVSWPLLLGDLRRTLEAGAPPPSPPVSYRAWTAAVHRHARDPESAAALERWLDDAPAAPAPLPRDFAGTAAMAEADDVAAALDAEGTAALLRRSPPTGMDELVLAALAAALADWTGSATLQVDVERHGRGPLLGVDPAHTVGWFTALVPVRLDAARGADAGALLREAKLRLRGLPDGGIALTALRYGPAPTEGRPAAVARRLREWPASDIAFNYQGRMDALLAEAGSWRVAREPAGPVRAPGTPSPHVLTLNADVLQGRLRLRLTYGAGTHRRDTAEALAARILDHLRALAADDDAGRVPSDFALAGLSEAQLDRIVARRRRAATSVGARP
jgi:amino acid adenylation domain-containing protein/non-ribosomal peptide synthase protein (TIGR01720 family)